MKTQLLIEIQWLQPAFEDIYFETEQAFGVSFSTLIQKELISEGFKILNLSDKKILVHNYNNVNFRQFESAWHNLTLKAADCSLELIIKYTEGDIGISPETVKESIRKLKQWNSTLLEAH